MFIINSSSFRRYHLNKNLYNQKHYLKSKIIDIGGYKNNDRYKKNIFVNKKIVYLNIDSKFSPDYLENFENNTISSELYDTVLMLETIEYFSNPHHALKEVSRILKKDGYFILSYPFLNPQHGDYENDLYRFSESFIKKFINENKFFDLVMIKRDGSIFAVIYDIFRNNILAIKKKVIIRFLFLNLLRIFKPIFYLLDSLCDKFNYSTYTGIFVILKKNKNGN